ncbi:DNA topoisomerase 1 [Labeo rohita]|uniref:DNA topoisomerase I n=1 Tax=Labeo rohita TaxID=84645 RepID=A0ABQ8LDD7_LABRO|nr:DNA topoisomerase 1 [Labeo rohita]
MFEITGDEGVLHVQMFDVSERRRSPNIPLKTERRTRSRMANTNPPQRTQDDGQEKSSSPEINNNKKNNKQKTRSKSSKERHNHKEKSEQTADQELCDVDGNLQNESNGDSNQADEGHGCESEAAPKQEADEPQAAAPVKIKKKRVKDEKSPEKHDDKNQTSGKKRKKQTSEHDKAEKNKKIKKGGDEEDKKKKKGKKEDKKDEESDNCSLRPQGMKTCLRFISRFIYISAERNKSALLVSSVRHYYAGAAAKTVSDCRWEEGKLSDSQKWSSLEHKGPYFPPEYEPLPDNVCFYYDATEEIATFYAKMLDHEYTTKEVFQNNFFGDWREVMTKDERKLIKTLSKCDFSQILKYFVEKSEERKNMTKEEKQVLKDEANRLMEEYGYCLLDGHREKIGNFKLEPPGLFRGRGEHPKMGKLKKRIQPEDVTINCSEDSKVPEPPAGHQWKRVQHDNTVTWLASWLENIHGRPKYIMLNPSSKLKVVMIVMMVKEMMVVVVVLMGMMVKVMMMMVVVVVVVMVMMVKVIGDDCGDDGKRDDGGGGGVDGDDGKSDDDDDGGGGGGGDGDDGKSDVMMVKVVTTVVMMVKEMMVVVVLMGMMVKVMMMMMMMMVVMGEKDWQKYETARRLKMSVDSIRKRYRRDWKSREMKSRQRGVAIYFIDKLALRAGNEKDDESADTVGCCSLRVEHIRLHRRLDGQEHVVEFDFLGKDSIRYYNKVPVEKQVFKNLKLFIKHKDPEDDLFDRITTINLNKTLNESMSGLTAKVFRTFNASTTLQDQLNKLTTEDMTVEEKILSYNRANRAVAILCNHQRAAPKTFEKSMQLLQEKIQKKKEQIEEAKKELKEAKKAHKDAPSDKSKKLLEKKEKAVQRLCEQLKKLQLQETDREENKVIALGTSKLNYLDPRITVACDSCPSLNAFIRTHKSHKNSGGGLQYLISRFYLLVLNEAEGAARNVNVTRESRDLEGISAAPFLRTDLTIDSAFHFMSSERSGSAAETAVGFGPD